MRRCAHVIVALAVLLGVGWYPVAAHDQTRDGARSPTIDLIARYAPILMLREQKRPCDPDGEPYVAAPIEVVLGDPAVALRGGGPGQPIVTGGPTAADIAGRDDTHSLDLPGNPLRPGCVYERRARERMHDLVPTALVHLAREEDRHGLAIQYWLFYYFNDWNNTHEGDWEMVQVVFDVDTVAEALQTDPVAVGFAQHGGGEHAAWDDPKLEREGDRPLVYVSRGSHASHFDRAVFLGWGEDSTGVGCDDTRGPSMAVPLQAQLIADGTRAPAQHVDWLGFRGRWGQRAPWEFDGPRGPAHYFKWGRPLSWQENLRAASLAVPLSGAVGPAPTAVFCRVTAASAALLRRGAEHPARVIAAGALASALLIVTMVAIGRTFAGAGRFYLRHFPAFLPAVGAVLAVGLGISLLRSAAGLLLAASPVDDVPAVRSLMAFVLGLVQQLAGVALVAPAAIYAATQSRAGQRPRLGAVLRAERAHLGRTTRALARPLLVIGLFGLLPFGVVPASYLLVRWLFVPQAVLLDGADPSEARVLSARAVRGHSLRTVGVAIVFALLIVALGPIVGVFLLISADRSVAVINLASSLVYAVVFPFVFTAATLLYVDRQGDDRAA